MKAFVQGTAEQRWDDVRVFLAAHRNRTLGQAAKKLRLDISTMSRRLSAFEASVGAQLFDRSREGLVPTRAAELVLAAAEAMEAAHARLTRDASEIEATAEGTVRLSVAPAMDQIIAPALVRLRKKHPGITLELDASTRPVDLSRHEADLALRSVEPVGAALLITKIGTGQWFAAGAPSLVKDLGRLKSWDDAPWICWDHDMAGFGPARWLSAHVPSAEIVFRTSLFSAQILAAETGLGVLLTPSLHLLNRRLTPVRYTPALEESARAWPVDGLWLVGHRALREVPRVAAVWRFLNEDLRRSL